MTAPPVTHVAYLHGFRSSPQSTKARKMAAWMAQHQPEVVWWCPQLPVSPAAALEAVMTRVRAWPPGTMAVVGSSLGGFYATCAAERLGCRAVVLNPAIHAARDLSRYVGEHAAWHDPMQRFVFEARFVDELRAMETTALVRPDNYFAVIAKGDEVLDWREMTARYAGARIRLLEGSDHALSGFDEYIHEVFAFLGLR